MCCPQPTDAPTTSILSCSSSSSLPPTQSHQSTPVLCSVSFCNCGQQNRPSSWSRPSASPLANPGSSAALTSVVRDQPSSVEGNEDVAGGEQGQGDTCLDSENEWTNFEEGLPSDTELDNGLDNGGGAITVNVSKGASAVDLASCSQLIEPLAPIFEEQPPARCGCSCSHVVLLPCPNPAHALLAVHDADGRICVISAGDSAPPLSAINNAPPTLDAENLGGRFGRSVRNAKARGSMHGDNLGEKPRQLISLSAVGVEAGTLLVWDGSVRCGNNA